MTIGSEHLHARKRLFKNLEPFPNPNRAKRMFDTLMLWVGPLAPIALFPQVLEIYMLRDAGSFSLVTWSFLATINTLWTIYGFIHREPPILIANAGLATLNIAIVVGILLF